MAKDKVTIFVSYSHDDDNHIKWVKKFVEDLREWGNFNVLYDQDLEKGASLPRFIELGIASSDKVLVIGTPEYKRKASLCSGVGFEEAIMGTEYMSDIDSTKFYPILRRGTFSTSFPTILTGRNGDDFSDDSLYENNLRIVVRSLLKNRVSEQGGQINTVYNSSNNNQSSNAHVVKPIEKSNMNNIYQEIHIGTIHNFNSNTNTVINNNFDKASSEA